MRKENEQSGREEKRRLQQCVEYFKSFPIYERVLAEFCRKYEGLGRVGGIVSLGALTREEKEQLQGFLPKVNPYDTKAVRISATDFEKALAGSRFAPMTLQMLLEAYFRTELTTKREEKARYESAWEELFAGVCAKSRNVEFREWMAYVLESRKNAWAFLQKRFKESAKELELLLEMMDEAIAKLPIRQGKILRLPVYATSVTGNPHAFDEGTPGEKMLTYFIKYRQEQEAEEFVFLTEEKWSRFYCVGIMKDDLSNYVLTYGIGGKMEDGSVHGGLAGYYAQRQPVHLSLWTLSTLSEVTTEEKSVYIVENPAVFAALVENFPTGKALICTNGQLRLASLVLLDLLGKKGVQLYYAGDFDPEGLQIADKLRKKYGEQLHFWLYEESLYKAAKSGVTLSKERLVKLGSIESEELFPIRDRIEREKVAGYQESILEEYRKDLAAGVGQS